MKKFYFFLLAFIISLNSFAQNCKTFIFNGTAPNDFSPPKLAKQYLGMACMVLMGFLMPCLTYAHTFSNTTDFPIPDSGTVNSTINISGLSDTVGSGGTPIIDLSSDNGGDANNFINTVFTDAATTNISAITVFDPPFTGSFKPEGPGAFASVFNGTAVNGTWTLSLTDDENISSGTILDWPITFQQLSSADLALVKTVNDNTPDQNQVITFTLVVSNAGPDAATSFEVTDVVPAGMTYLVGSMTGPGTYVNGAPATTGLKWQNLFLQNGGSLVLTFQATVTAAGGTVITNFAQVTASAEADADSTPNNGNIGEDDGDVETVTVNIPNPPVVLTCPVNTTTAACQTQTAVNAAFATWLATASGSGGCNGVLTNNNTGAPPACGGSTTVTFTYVSTCAPFTTTCNATFTVSAPASPTPVLANCTNNTVSLGCNPNTLPSCAGIAAGAFGGAVTASNSCGTVPVTCSAGSITINGCNRTQIFTFEATACGQTVTCTRTFIWTQVTPPSFNGTCGNGVVNLGCNPATLPSCDPNVTASNECGAITVTCNVGAITTNGCNRSQTLTYVANAPGCGTFSTCQRVFNWQVTTAPVFGNCDNTIDLGCNPATLPSCANINQAAFGGAITATNECGNVSMSCTGGPITVNGCNRTQIFTISATGCSLTSTCTRTFTWTVATAPVFANCTSGTTDLGCNPSTLPSCDAGVTATNECGAVTVTCTPGSITSNGCDRSQVFTYTATACGLTSTCTRTFTWQVGTVPVLTCPTNTTVAACQTQAAVNAQFNAWLATASFSGGCGAVLTNNNTGAPSFCGGSATVTFTLNSSCQAPVTCQATFTVTAAPPPSLTCPNPLIRPVCQTRAQDSIALLNWVNTSSFGGGCNGSINFNGFDGRPPSSCGGTKTLTLTYTSSCAAPLTCTSTFTIPAPAAPVLTCPTNTTTPFGQTQAQVNAAFVTWLSTASGTGGCNGVLSNNNFGAPPATGGSVTVTFSYSQSPPSTPFSGACPFSTITCQATFSVSATPPVVLTCPTNTTTTACQTQAAVNAAFNAWLATASGTGGCNGVLTNNNTGAPPACGGSTTVTFTYTSTCAPFTTTCQAFFSVPAPPPVSIICPVPTTVASCQSQAAINAQYAAWLATFNGQGGCNLTGSDNGNFPPSNCGEAKTVTFTLTSTCAPTTTSCQSTFTVTTAPPVVLTCPTNTTVAACQTQAAVNTAFATWLATVSASGGCNGSLTNNNTGAPAACGGSTTVTFTYTSSCAPTTTTCQATFTVPAAPTVVLTCPSNTTAAACQTQAAVNTAFATWLATATASGGCNGSLTNNNTGAPAACGGSTTVTFTYTSTCAPLTTTCQATFTVPAAPTVVLTCPTNTTAAACQTQAAVNTAFATWLATASASGGCNGVLTNNNTGAPSACGGSTTVTFTYTSTCVPLTSTCQATFTVPAAPTVVLTCPTNQTEAFGQTQATINAKFAAWLATATGTGGCGGSFANNNTGAPPATGGSTTVTFTKTSDCAPLTTTCQATFTVSSIPPVVLICPTNTTASACLTQTQLNTVYNTWLASASGSGGCNGALTNNSPGVPSICSATAVTQTVTFTYTSTCAPFTTTCQSTFTVPAYPTFTVPANGAATVACPALATPPTPPTVQDVCGKTLTPTGPVIVNTPNPIACEGTRTYTYAYTDCAGTVRTWSFVYTIERNDFTVPANGAVTVSNLSEITTPTLPLVTSNCGETLTPTGPVIVNNPNPLVCSGTSTYTYTYTDCEGNSHPWSFTYTLLPTVLNVSITGLNTAYCKDASAVTLTGNPTGGNFTIDGNAATTLNPATLSIGNHTVTYNFTDANGCSNSSSQTVTINALPIAYNVTGTGAYCNGSSGLAVGLSNSELGVAYQLKSGSTNIGTAQNGTNAAISFGNQGIGTYTVVATNTVSGCTATMAGSAVISANTAPPTIAVKDITLNLNSAGTGTVTPSQVDNGTTGFCAIATRQLSKTDFNCSNIGANIVTFTATDVNNNSATATAKITVKDVSVPTVIVKDITVNLVDCAASITAAQVNNGSSDNCAITSMNVTPNTFAFANIGQNIVTFTATDASGNSTSTTLTVTVNNVTGSISGHAWKDLDNNGIQGGTGEIGIVGLSVMLYNSDVNGNKIGAAISNMNTGTNGIYTFSNVNKGDYVVEIDKTQITNMGMILSKKLNIGGNDVLDNDFIFASGLTEKIVLDPCDIAKKNITNVNAGVTILGSIGDRFWKDNDNNGIQDNGEAGIAGVNLELYFADANGNPTGAAIKTATTTAPNGDYRFEELDNGMYVVKTVLSSIAPTMELSKKKDLGGNDALDSDFDRFTGLSPKITIVPTNPTQKDILTIDGAIRNKVRGTIGDVVWKDLIENGIQENCEKGVPNITMEIFMKNPQTSVLGKLDTISGVFTPNVPMFTTTTNAAGKYLFSNLEDETWVVKLVKSSIGANMELSPSQNQGGNDASDSDFNATTALSDEVSLDPYSATLRHNVSIDAAIRNTPCDNLKAAAASFENTTGTLSVANTTVNISISTTNSQILRTSQDRAATIFADNAYSTKAISGGYLVIKDKRDENGLVTLNFNATVSNPILYFKDIVRRKLDLSSSVDVNGNPICLRKISGNTEIQVDEMFMTLQNSDPAQAGSPTQAINQGAVAVQLIGDFSSIKIESSSLFAASDNWTMSIASEDYNCGSPLVTLPIIVKNSITNILPKDPNNPTGNMLVTFEVEINNPTAIKCNNLFVEDYLDEKWGAGLVGISEAPHIIFPHNSFIIQANPNYNGITDVNLLKPDMNNMINGGDLIRIRYSIELNPTQFNSFTNKSIAKALALRFENKIIVGSTSQLIFLSNLSAFNIPVYLPSSIVLPTNPVEDIAGGTVPVYYAMWLQCFGKSMVTPDPQCGKVTWGFDRTPKPYTQNCGNTGIWHTLFIGVDECGNQYHFTADFTAIDKNPPVWDMKPMDKSIVCSSATASQDLAMWLNTAGGAWFSDPGDDKNSKITISSDFVNTNLNCAAGPRVVKFTLTDACGNSTSETAKLSIIDSEAPKFTSVPANITVKCDATNYTFGTPTATDNCSVVTLTSKDADTGVNCTTGGTKTRVWTASDACGNTATASQTIYFEPKTGTKPVVFTMTNKVADKIIACNEPVVFDTPTIESSCANGSETSSSYVDTQTAGKCGNNINYIRKWTFTDKCNNHHNINQTISVVDNIAPTFKADLPTSFKMKKSLFNVWKKLYFKNYVKATDNCSAVTLSAPTYKFLSTKSVECTVVANDQCGNASKYVCIVTFEEASTISISSKAVASDGDSADIALFIDEHNMIPTFDSNDSNPFELHQNRPNPFSQETTISFILTETNKATLTIFDITGRQIYSISDVFDIGENQVVLDKSIFQSTGIYFYRLSSGTYSAVKKLQLITE